MDNKIILCALLVSIGQVVPAQTGWFPDPETARQELTVYRITSAPAIDGDLSDAVWRKLPRTTGMTDITFRHDYVPDQTLFTVAYDDASLYIAVDARDRFPELIKGTVTGRDVHLWSAHDDVIELFFDPDNTGRHFIQIAVNPLATQWDSRRPEGASWNGNWRAGTERTSSGWTAEFAFPFADMKLGTPEPGDRLSANIARTSRGQKAEVYSSWSIIRQSFHNTADYGDWVFAGGDADVSRDLELSVNREFMASERQRLASLVASAAVEVELAERLPEASRGGLQHEMAAASAAASRLGAELNNTPTLDRQIESGVIGFELRRTLRSLANRVCMIGLAGPFDGLSITERGVARMDSHWVLSGRRGIFALVGASGVLGGVWDRAAGQRVIAASHDLYVLETMDDKIHADERFDRVEHVAQSGSAITFTCANPAMPDVKIVKRYTLLKDGDIIAKQVSVSRARGQRTLLGVSSATVFDREYRESSRYNRVMSCGSAGGSDERPTIDATEITKDLLQRGGNNKACGYAQFVLANRATKSGIAQYLYKTDGKYVWIPYAMPGSHWNSNGWEISFLGCFLNQKPFSSEMRYHLFDGDQVEFYHEYLELPEVRAARAEHPASPLMAGLHAAGYGESVLGALQPDFPGSVPRLQAGHDQLRSDEINLCWGIPRHNLSGHWPTSDDDHLIWINEKTDAMEKHASGRVRRASELVRKRFPRHRLGLYSVHTSLNPESATYKAHPEFALQNKDGSITASTHFGNREYDADMSPAWTDYVTPQYGEYMDFFGMGFLYFDFFGGYSAPDWHDGRVTQSTDFMYFDKAIRTIVEARDGVLWFNGNPGQLCVDLNFIEAMGNEQAMDLWGPDWWRWHHERMYYYKLFERENTASMPLIWVNYKAGDRKSPEGVYEDNNRQYANLILALGFRPHPCYYEYGPELTRDDGTVDYARIYNYERPYHLAALEMHNTRVPRVGLEPRFWTDSESRVEAYVLKKGPACFFTALQHYDKPTDITTSADAAKLGFEAGKRLFRWDYTRRDDDKVPRLIGPETPGWDRLFTKIRCASSVLGAEPRITVTFPDAEMDYTYVATLTQVPGALVAKEGIELQFRLPEALRCSLGGEVDETTRKVTLKARAVTAATAAAWWPGAWGAPKVTVNGRVLSAPESVAYGQEQFLLVPVGRGESRITVMTGES